VLALVVALAAPPLLAAGLESSGSVTFVGYEERRSGSAAEDAPGP
jgi:hypothetical protein